MPESPATSGPLAVARAAIARAARAQRANPSELGLIRVSKARSDYYTLKVEALAAEAPPLTNAQVAFLSHIFDGTDRYRDVPGADIAQDVA